ncbi:MAG: SxtJ family membrane protein [Candidatus Omnitrophota bacterium]|jgi:multisubunit Na+/H+ antiporter MnhG subunit
MKTDRNTLKKFGVTMGVALAAITLLFFFKHHRICMSLAVISLGVFLTGFFFPLPLKPVYIFWMRLALVLSWVNTRIILVLVFYLVFTPLGLLMRMFGKDLLERKIERSGASYWKRKDVKPLEKFLYEKQF